MKKRKQLGVALVMFLAACGGESPRETAPPGKTQDEAASTVSCEDIEQVVEHVRRGLGSCTPNYKNQEPLAFSRATCDAEFGTVCGAGDQASIQAYVTCLRAVAACDPANQSIFDNAIDDCLDTFQNSDADGTCIELVVGD